jgi:lipopolysaccharide transport system permease protein
VLRPPRWNPLSWVGQLGTLADYTDLLAVLSRHRINVRYRQSVLGGMWAFLQPLAMMVVFTLVFSRLVRVPTDGVPYAPFAYAGILPWTFFSAAVSNGTTSLVSHAQLVTKVYFPREILPISYVVAAAVDLLIGSSVLVLLLLYFSIPLTSALVLVVPTVVALAAFALSCTLVLAAIQVRVRDVGVALPVALQLWMFGSPVLYPLHVVPAAWRPLFVLNPMTGFIETFRSAVLGMPWDVDAFSVACVVTLLVLPLSYVVFKYSEATMADVV